MKLILVSPAWLSVLAFIFLIKSLKSTTARDSLLNYRLPNETYPEHYDIKLTIDMHSKQKGFQGEIIIDIVVVTATDKIVLHALQIKISKVTIASSTTGKTEVLFYQYERKKQFLTFRREHGNLFRARSNWKLTISYKGKLRDDGLQLSNYSDENGTVHYAAFADFKRGLARHAFPCYDEPAKLAEFTITINHSPNLTAISNMPVNEKDSRAGKTVFLTTKPMATYLVSFVICDYEYTEAILNGVRYRVYSRSSKKQQLTPVSALLYINYFAQYCGIDYMFPKLDFVTVEEYGLLVTSYRGLIILKESPLLLSRGVAAQWLENYVSIEWWSSHWLASALEILLSYKAVADVHPELNIWETLHLEKFNTDMKSVSFLFMWQNALGEEVFRRAIQKFLINNRYRGITEDDLFVELEESAEVNNIKLPAAIHKMIKTWADADDYPILTVTRNYKAGNFSVKQETFAKLKSFADNRTRYIPINFAVASNADFRDTKATHYLSDTNETEVDALLAADDWLILDKSSVYYYRIRYDEQNYKLIAQTLIEQPFKIHVRNRYQLLDDALTFSTSKYLKPTILFEMLAYLKNEDHPTPWRTVTEVMYEYRNLANFREFKVFFRDLVGPIFKKVGVDKIPNEHINDNEIRKIVVPIACWAGVKECLVAVHTKLRAYLFQNITIDPDIKISVLYHGLEQADDSDFEVAFEKSVSSKDISESMLLMASFGLAQNETFVKKFLSTSIDMSKNLRIRERNYIIAYTYTESERGLLMCIDFLDENWDAYEIIKRPYDPFESILYRMSRCVFNTTIGNKLLALVAKVKDRGFITHKLESKIKNQIEKNYKWLQEYGMPLMEWISRYNRVKTPVISPEN